MDMHTHFLRDDTRLEGFVRARGGRQGGWNPELVGKPQTIDDLKFQTTSRRSISTATPRWRCSAARASEDPRDWFLTNEMKADARAEGQQAGRFEAHVLARHLHAGLRRLDGRGRP
jgi:hypothetical protein